MLVRFCMRRGEFMLEVCVRDIMKAVEAEEAEEEEGEGTPQLFCQRGPLGAARSCVRPPRRCSLMS